MIRTLDQLIDRRNRVILLLDAVETLSLVESYEKELSMLNDHIKFYGMKNVYKF